MKTRGKRSLIVSALVGFSLAAAACGVSASVPTGSAPTQAPQAAGPATPTAAAPTTAASPSPSPGAGERISGTVKSVAADKVTLADGKSFSVTSNTRYTKSVAITPAELAKGQYVAVTAKRQPDNTLLASIVNIFPESFGQVGVGQRPMEGGNLMTNATIDQIDGATFTLVFPGGGAKVQLAPDAKVNRIVLASLTDIPTDGVVSAQVVNGVARAVSIQNEAQTASSSAASAAGGSVQVRDDARLGKILTDSSGRTLYRFDKDGKGSSACSGGCLQNWPPLVVASGDPKAPQGLTGELAAFKRGEGQTQVTYNDAPLYRYAADAQPGDTKGDGVGGVWHVVHPEGYTAAASSTPGAQSSKGYGATSPGY